MHALLNLVLGQGIEWFILLGRCELQSTPDGISNFRLVDPINSNPSKAQSLILRSSNPIEDFMAYASSFGSSHLEATFNFKITKLEPLPIEPPLNHDM